MLKSKGFARVSTFAALKASLQQYLGRERGEVERPAPPLHFGWLRTPGFGWQRTISEGAHIAIELQDGRRYVGQLVHLGARYLTLELWGCSGAVTRFQTSELAGAGVVGPHSHREERVVCERQRRGEPAAHAGDVQGHSRPSAKGRPMSADG